MVAGQYGGQIGGVPFLLGQQHAVAAIGVRNCQPGGIGALGIVISAGLGRKAKDDAGLRQAVGQFYIFRTLERFVKPANLQEVCTPHRGIAGVELMRIGL